MVSVICATYNHEIYIQEAVESFLMQETNFPFEIIIHDDASTDNTPKIIKEYYSRYPDIIKPILQKENQYSKGGFKPSVYAAEYSRGKYIALCEGDDYWINNNKLQIQIDALQKHPDVDFSFHSAYRLYNNTQEKIPSWNYKYDRILQADTILTSQSFAPTASYVLRKNLFSMLPDWFYRAQVGDFYIEMYGAKRGGALYINTPMSIYRVNARGSWSSNCITGDRNYLRRNEKMLKDLERLKFDFTDHLNSFAYKESLHNYNIAVYYLLNGNYKLFLEYIESSFAIQPFSSTKQKILYRLRLFPSIVHYFFKLKYINNLITTSKSVDNPLMTETSSDKQR